ncbi:MAG: hypothetical protein JJE51_13380 [Thermoanaerobaculia bacterium]|nr:hypothetical protein [Thermoanaerobaculia bacterium]
MSERCQQETHVARAAVGGTLSESLRAHVAGCSDCAAAAAIAPFMTRFARTNERQRRLPDASVIWLKAQLLRGSVMAERVSRPLNVLQIASYVLVAGGWAAVVTWKWSNLQQWLLSVTPERLVGGLVGTESALSIPFLLTVVGLASLTVMVALHTILAEE